MNEKYFNSGRTNQKLETRSKILASAQYFLNKGLEFNLEDVAKKSGISRATVYRYYSNIDVLSTEAGLDVSTKSPEALFENLKDLKLEEQILGVQNYFNTLAIDHENTFRKYLSTVIISKESEAKRGARRKRTLELVLENTSLTDKEKVDLSNILTLLMGIEPLIISKDVCGLTNEESLETLNKAMRFMLKGLINPKG
ncbi:MAG: TetR/AcrR family transcriptional regulator [Jejuia sp.]